MFLLVFTDTMESVQISEITENEKKAARNEIVTIFTIDESGEFIVYNEDLDLWEDVKVEI